MAIATVVFGVGGMGREARQWLNDAGTDVLGFLDDNLELHGQKIAGLPVLGSDPWLANNPATEVVVALGDSDQRRQVVDRLRKAHVRFGSLRHPTVSVADRTRIGCGCLLCPRTMISIDVQVGDFVLFTGAVLVGHDSVIGDFVTLCPSVNVLGTVTIEDGCLIGTSAILLPGITIGAGSVVCAGSIVRRDVSPGMVVAGSPARTVAPRAAPTFVSAAPAPSDWVGRVEDIVDGLSGTLSNAGEPVRAADEH